MRWSWKLGRFAGIDVYMHATFLLLLGWIGLSHWVRYRSVAATLMGVAFILALFLCVVLHEYGHALTARRFGVKTRDIILLPIGGVARLERIPERPSQELLVALAGPAVNVVIAAVLAAYLFATGQVEPMQQMGVAHGGFLERLLVTNIFLVGFNMIPAFPMDGGRVLRALLATRLNYGRATEIAAAVGQALALAFGFIGLFTNPFLIFVALFVWIGAASESAMVQAKSIFGGARVRDAMISDFRVLSPTDPVSHAASLVLSGFQQDFPVVQQGRVVGILLRSDLIDRLARGGAAVPVGEAMRRDFSAVQVSDPLESVVPRLNTGTFATLPVFDRDALVGVLTRENVTEYLLIHSALRKSATGVERGYTVAPGATEARRDYAA